LDFLFKRAILRGVVKIVKKKLTFIFDNDMSLAFITIYYWHNMTISKQQISFALFIILGLC